MRDPVAALEDLAGLLEHARPADALDIDQHILD